MKIGLASLLSALLTAGCMTFDVERSAQNQIRPSLNLDEQDNIDENTAAVSKESALIEETIAAMTPETIILEKPVYVPAQSNTPAAPTARPGSTAAAAAAASGTKLPEISDFTAAAVVYDYYPDWVYEVYASPSRVVDICLEEEETPLELPFISDSDRWILGGGKSMAGGRSISHIYVKPKEQNLSASMVINTDRRSYHILLRSYNDIYMPIVRWQYKLYFPSDFFAARKNGGASYAGGDPPLEISHEIVEVDPRFLSYDYKIIYSLGGKPAWFPRLVYDDGKKTYISFGEGVLQRELPAVFENRNDIVNYRVSANLIIIDKLIEKITVRLSKTRIIIEKKR